MWGRHFDWYHFDPVSSPYPPNGDGGRIGGPLFDIGIPAKRWQIEKNFVLKGIQKSWVGFRLVQLVTL